MPAPDLDRIQAGDAIPALRLPAISRTTLALFAGASGDHNPIHVDVDLAKAAGLPDVIAHGMLVMAYAGRALTTWLPQSRLRQFGVRFAAMTRVHDVLTCSGRVAERVEQGRERRVRVELSVTNQDGDVKLTGEAVVAIG